MKNNDEQLNNIRHSAAHLLAAAVMELWPDTKRTIGPSIENGFYYDFDFAKPISEEDLPKIEKKMAEILPTWEKTEGREVLEQEAREMYQGNEYKHELIDEILEKGEKLTVFKSGNYEDLCRGGHSENPKQDLKHFRLLSIAGAYWKGSEKNKMLTRIYGTVFPTQQELKTYLNQLEEAKKRDHRKIGQDLELFTFSDEVGPGLPLWLPKGTIIKEELEKFAKETENKRGYQRVSTPHLAKDTLYYKSGHLPYYADDMYPPMKSDEGTYYLKPMNCPHMHIIYKTKNRSYKELPLRYAEFGTVYRFEDSGTLMGLMRVRGHTQNDAHVYCMDEEQALNELVDVMKLHEYYFNLLGIKDYYIELALPDFEKKKDKYFDNPQAWEKSIDLLKKAAQKAGVEVVEDVGGAAFYGPKFDFNVKSATGRKFSITTNQLDFGSGKNFDLKFINQGGSESIIPYIIHRAPLGSHERFIGYLIEHFAGAFPTWLSPVQVQIIPISDKHLNVAKQIYSQLYDQNIRTEVDDRSETMQAKIRDAQIQKIPYMIIIGDRELSENKISVRKRNGENLNGVDFDQFLDRLKEEIAQKQ